MKKILPILFIAILSGFMVNAQDGAPTREQLMKQVDDAKKEVAKLEKKLKKAEKSVKDSEKGIKEAELGKEQSVSQKESKQDEIDVVKAEMAGFNLGGLEDQLKALEMERKKLESTSERNDKSIAKKRGQIETLHAEINALEEENTRNYETVVTKNEEIKAVNNDIASNGLVEKEASLKTKKTELAKIVKAENRFSTTITKESTDIEKAKINIGTYKSELKSQKDLINAKQRLLDTPK